MKTTLLSLITLFICVHLSAQIAPQALDLTGCNCFVTAIDAVSDDVVWVATQKSNFAASRVFGKTTDGGSTWTTGLIPVNLRMIGLTAVDDQNAWVALSTSIGEGQVYHTSDGGTNWTRQTDTEYDGGFLNQIHFFSLTEGVTLGDVNNGYWEIYTTSDGGTTWTRVPEANIPNELSSEAAHPNFTEIGDNIWFGTTKGRVYHSADKGHTWTVSNVYYQEVIPFFTDELNGVATSPFTNNPVHITTDGGVTWTSKPVESSFSMRFTSPIKYQEGNYVFTGSISGGPLKLFYTTDNFDTYSLLDDANTYSNSLTFSQETKGWISNSTVGSAQGIFKYDSGFPLATEIVVKKNDLQVQFFPNPVTDFAQVLVTSSQSNPTRLSIMDLTGKVFYVDNRKLSVSSVDLQLDLQDLAPGIYFLKIESGMEKSMVKFAVQ